jgi:predicted ribosome quality control (RQC) complex YloA/Tae2 family protein
MPREIQLSSGSTVLIGKNAKDNENLTFKLSREGDVWFHVEDYPGSHVILRSGTITKQEIRETAEIAAYHSQARSEKKVLVMYTLIQNVRKESKTMGEVIVDEYKTINISPQKR